MRPNKKREIKKANAIFYMNMSTGEITDIHRIAVKEFFNKGDDVDVLLFTGNRFKHRTTWTHR